MAQKLGSQYAWEQLDKGRRELGGFFFPDSNIAQPNYPVRGPVIGKEIEAPTTHELETPRDDKGRDDRDRGMDRE
jgi:hypothetical protein